MKKLNNINPEENNALKSSKYNKFVENTKRAVRKALITTGIVAGSMGPITTSSVVPASANSINRITPTTPTTIKTIGQGTSAELLIAFDEKCNVPTNDTTDNYTAPTNETNQINIKGKTTNTAENNNLNIEVPGYKAIEITNIKPVDILPIIGQVESGDKQCYEHIEHLRVAEATRIRDMMREYGAGNHSPEEYQKLMGRLNTGMRGEIPLGYDNYEIIGKGTLSGDGSEHAHTERFVLSTLIKHGNLKLVNGSLEKSRQSNLTDFIQSQPNSINIFGCSSYSTADNKNDYNIRLNKQDIKDLCNSNNFIIFAAGTNIGEKNGYLKNKIYNGEYEADEYGRYSLASMANSNKDTQPNSHLLVTIATSKYGDINQTNEIYESSKFPIGFKDNILFSGRAFPRHSTYGGGRIEAESGKYATSHTNYVNVALTDLCFQMKADIADVDELLEMIRSTALTDYIRFDLNGDGDTDDTYDGQPETQPLILMNPAGFFQKYLMPTNLPTSLRTNENIDLEKGYYHGVIYQIPGAEVNINNQRITFSDENKDLILAQNPMTLKWRLNGELLNSYNYKPGDTINGQIIVVDDMWNGLNITKDFSVSIEEANGINDTKISPSTPNSRYTIDGHRLNTKPTKPGIYIVNGQKVIIK